MRGSVSLLVSLDLDPHSTPGVLEKGDLATGGQGTQAPWVPLAATPAGRPLSPGSAAANARPGPFPGNSWLCREQPVSRN